MSHPNSETLADFLYDELASERRKEVETHLAACGECKARLDAWQQVRRELKGWTVPAGTRTGPSSVHRFTALKWAAAAAIFTGAGFALATLTRQPLDLAPVHAQLAQEIREEVRQELSAELANYSKAQDARQAEFQQAIVQAMGRLEARQQVQHASLRKDVETVAVRAQEELERLVFESPVIPVIDQ